MSNANTMEPRIGLNRTGIGLSPLLSGEMINSSAQIGAPPAERSGELALGRVRQEYGAQKEPVGSMPPPSSLKGVAETAVDLIKGQQPTVLLDRLGDRLAYERTGVRLYGALIDKLGAWGSWEGGPAKAELESIQQDELRHFELLREVLEAIGADPTVVTPAADVCGVEILGVLQVISDPRTTLPQALHAILTAELVDNDGWRMLIDLVKLTGHDELVSQMQRALLDEDRHLSQVRGWLQEETRLAAQRELQPVPRTSTSTQ
jgi:rubrerythrin